MDLPGAANRFDYQDLDTTKGRLVMAHMNDDSVVVFDIAARKVVGVVKEIPTARGVATAPDVGRIFVTSTPGHVVIIDDVSLAILARVETGSAPDGVAWDPDDQIVGVSAQGDGALSLLSNKGDGERKDVALGKATGNVVYDAGRKRFWVAVESAKPPDQIVSVDPVAAAVVERIDLPGCEAAHGLRLDPKGETALVACEDNAVLARVKLDGSGDIVTADTADGPDVLSVDPGLGWVYVAAEGGGVSIFDIGKPGLTELDREDVGDNAHTVQVDPATHDVYFPLEGGPQLRIMRPKL